MSFLFQVTTWTEETWTRYSKGGKGAFHQSQVRIKDEQTRNDAFHSLGMKGKSGWQLYQLLILQLRPWLMQFAGIVGHKLLL